MQGVAHTLSWRGLALDHEDSVLKGWGKMFMNQSVLKQGNCKSFKFTHTHTQTDVARKHTHALMQSLTHAQCGGGRLVDWLLVVSAVLATDYITQNECERGKKISGCQSWNKMLMEELYWWTLATIIFYYLTKELGLGLYTRLWREEVFLRGPEGDKDGLREPRVVDIDGAGEGVEVHSLHGQVDARHEAL